MSSQDIYLYDDMNFSTHNIPIDYKDYLFINLISLIHVCVLHALYHGINGFRKDKFFEGSLFTSVTISQTQVKEIFNKNGYNINEYKELYNLFVPSNLFFTILIIPFKPESIDVISDNIKELENIEFDDFDKKIILNWKDIIVKYATSKLRHSIKNFVQFHD